MTSGECNSTLDCLKVGNGVPRVCYEDVDFSEQTFFCDCSNWYGWTGENCDKPTSMTHFSLAFLSLLSVWAAVLMFLCGRTLYFHVRSVIFRKKTKRFNPVFFTGLLVLLGSILISIYVNTNIAGLVNSKDFTVYIHRELFGKDLEDVSVKGGKLAVYGFISSGIVCILIAAQIVISWYDVIDKTSQFFPYIAMVSPHHVKLAVKCWMLLVTPTTIILLSFSLLNGAVVVLFIAVVTALIFYLGGGTQFVKALQKLSGNQKNHSRNARKIVIISVRFNTILVLFELIFISVDFVLYQIIDQNLEPGSFNPLALVRYLNTACVLTILTFNSWYVHTITRNVLHLEESRNWLPSLKFNSERSIRKVSNPNSQDDTKRTHMQSLQQNVILSKSGSIVDI